jgi:hypothetical protein
LPEEEERQKIKDLLFILEKINVSESAYRELTVFCDIFLDLLFSVISENSFPLFVVPTFLFIDFT